MSPGALPTFDGVRSPAMMPAKAFGFKTRFLLLSSNLPRGQFCPAASPILQSRLTRRLHHWDPSAWSKATRAG